MEKNGIWKVRVAAVSLKRVFVFVRNVASHDSVFWSADIPRMLHVVAGQFGLPHCVHENISELGRVVSEILISRKATLSRISSAMC